MGDAQSIQRVELEISYGEGFPTFHCPLCGKQVLTPKGPDACPHLLYFYADAAGCFVHLSPRLDDIVVPDEPADSDGAVDDDDEWDVTAPLRKAIAARWEDPRGLIEFRVTHGGMACGPVWFTDVYGFDVRRVG